MEKKEKIKVKVKTEANTISLLEELKQITKEAKEKLEFKSNVELITKLAKTSASLGNEVLALNNIFNNSQKLEFYFREEGFTVYNMGNKFKIYWTF